MKQETAEKLINAALEARERSYCPYSHFAVGAALLASDGTVYVGTNIESSSYTPTVCAERVAFFSAIADGASSFSAIAVVGGASDSSVSSFCPPCGVCRQVMAEFCDPDFTVLLYNGRDIKEITLGELLPESFGKNNLNR